MQTHYGEHKPSKFDDINPYYKSLPRYFTRLLEIRAAIDADPGTGWIQASGFAVTVRSAVEKDKGKFIPSELLEAAEMLERLALEKLGASF